jgi:flagellar motor switch protein FliG
MESAKIRMNLSGMEKAALLIMGLERDSVAKVLKHLSAEEVRRLLHYVEQQYAGVRPDEEATRATFRQFLSNCGFGAVTQIREALAMAYGAEGVDRILRRDRWQAMAEKTSPEALAEFLRNEQPELIAAILFHLPPRFAAETLSRLSEEQKIMAVECMSRGVNISNAGADAVLEALELALSSQSGVGEDGHARAVEFTAQVLNQMDSETASRVVERIRAQDPERARAIEQEMFHFEDLLRLDRRTLNTVLSEIKPESIAMALKGIDRDRQQVVLAGLSDENREVVREEMDALGRVAMRDVQAARREITAIALRLDHEGKIRIRAGDEMVE